jgi:hypothetical protein
MINNQLKSPSTMENKMRKKTHKEFLNQVAERYGSEYTVLGRYIKTHVPIKLKHNKCGNIWDTTAPYDFLKENANTCPKCSWPSRRKTNKEFILEVFKLVGAKYTFLEIYRGNKIKLKVRHNCKLCNCHTFYTKPNLFLNGCRCPKCHEILNKSKGILKIERFLKRNSIDFQNEYGFMDKHTKRPDQKMKFDIYIKSFNIAIEFDGAQHFKPNIRWGGLKGLEMTQKRDQRKNVYCKENNIHLIRISYLKFKRINKILKKEFYNLGILK